MDCKKYGMVAFFGLLIITTVSAADISGYLRGVVHGIGMVFLVYGLYKSVTVSLALKKDAKQQESEE